MATPTETRPLIELRNVQKIYGSGSAEVHALAGASLQIAQGEFIAIMGPSGCGKSTCMNILGGLDTPTSGTYLFRGVAVERLSLRELALLRRHYFGFVFQGFNLLPRTSAQENVELPLVYRGMSAGERRVRATKALREVGLAGREGHTPSELSGGQQQRVAIARAIASEPQLLLADEPTGNLDSVTKVDIMNLLTGLCSERDITIVMVTHEPDMAEFASRTIFFRDGRVVSDTPEVKAA